MGRGVSGNQFPTFDAEFKFAKIQNSHVQGGGGGRGGVGGNQFLTFDVEFKFAKIQNCYVQGGRGGSVETNFQRLMLSSNLLKSNIPMFRGGVGGNQFPTFDAEFKFAKIQNSHVQGWVGGGGGRRGRGVVDGNQFPTFDAEFKFAKIQNSYFQGGGSVETNFQLLMLSPNLLKSQIPMSSGGGGVGWWKPISNC